MARTRPHHRAESRSCGSRVNDTWNPRPHRLEDVAWSERVRSMGGRGNDRHQDEASSGQRGIWRYGRPLTMGGTLDIMLSAAFHFRLFMLYPARLLSSVLSNWNV